MIVVLRNDVTSPPALLEAVLRVRDLPYRVVCLDRGEPVPGPEGVGALVALGGAMGAYEVEEYPFLAEEQRLLATAVDRGVPVLGLCLGCQLLADALGGRAYRAERPECVFAPVELTAAGHDDPVAASLEGRRVVRMHQDTWDLPPGASLLAEGGGFHQLFRLGSGLGVQPHPEVTAELVVSWLDMGADRKLAHASGTDPDLLAGELRRARGDMRETAKRFFGAWLDEVRAVVV